MPETDAPPEQTYTPIPQAAPAFRDVAGQLYGPALEKAYGQRDVAAEERQRAIGARGEAVKGAVEQYQAGRQPFPEPPPVITLPKPPTRQLSDFLAPVDNQPPERSIMQLISALTAIGTGMGGLVKGDARASLSALTGMMTGWQEGQRERADRAFADWQAATETLLKNAEQQHIHYRDLMEQANKTNEERLNDVKLAALKNDDSIMAAAAKVGDADAVIGRVEQNRNHLDNLITRYESMRQAHELGMLRLEMEKQRLDLERSRIIAQDQRWQESRQMQQRRLELSEASGKRAEELTAARLRVLNMPAQALKLAQQDIGISRKLTQADRLEEAVKYLDEQGIIPKGPTMADRLKATLALQTKVGDPEIGKHIETLNRWGTSLLLSTEIQTAGAASTFRIKSIAEKEAGNVQYVPKSFWDEFLKDARRDLKAQQENARTQLRAYKGAQSVISGAMGEAGAEGDVEHYTVNPNTGELE